MKGKTIRKALSLLMAFTFIFQQAGFAQGLAQLDMSRYMSQANTFAAPEKFRPLQLRYLSYNPLTNNLQILLDKGDIKKIADSQIKEEGQVLLKYFLVGVSLPDENFWVNLRPDSEDAIIGTSLDRTDLGKVLLEADLQLKKDVAAFTSPQTAEGKAYWTKLYEKANQLFGSQNITIPTLTRPWIVPGEVIIRENEGSAYVYKATLKVMLEQDHLKNSADYNFSDPRLKELNEYSSQLIRQTIIPKLTREVNSTAKYATLRQAFSSLVLSRWFKARFTGKTGLYSDLINTGNLSGLTSKESWSKNTYFKEYAQSFAKGEYSIQEQVNTASGPAIRTYFSGGVAFAGKDLVLPTEVSANSAVATYLGKSLDVAAGLLGRNNKAAYSVDPGLTLNPVNGNLAITSGTSSKVITAASALDTDTSKESARFSLVYNDNPRERAEQITYLLGEIDKELANPGSSNLPYIALIGDYHGAADRFAALLSNILNKLIGFQGQLASDISIESQLRKQGLSLKDIKRAIYLHGDILDRGANGIQCFFGIKELLERAPGKAFYISGNHDFWAFGNLLGIHLPWYQGFHFYGDTEAERIIGELRQSHPEYFDSQNGFLWWTERLAEYNAYQEKFQKEFLEGQAKQLREKYIEYYKKYSKNWTSDQLDAMEDFIGHFARIDVPDPFVGLNGMGKTSAPWWQRLSKQLSDGFEARKADIQKPADTDELAGWQEAISLADKISREVANRLSKATAEGQEWYRVFESINDKAYATVEWWAKDWSSHKDWGEAVIKELNAMLKNPKFTHPLIQQDREEFKGQEVTQANYVRSHTLAALSLFYRQNFNLYLKSPYNDLVTHGWLPVESDGRVVISYKGRDYSGKEIYQGLRSISGDVKDTSKPLQDVWEALSLVNSWYADRTTTLKPRDEKRYREQIGIAKINTDIGVSNWLTGHNPVNKLKVPFLVTDGDYAHLHLDKGMATKFGGEGAFVLIGPEGISLYGFTDKESQEIIEAPDTIIPGKEGEASKVIKNAGMPAKDFLGKTKAALGKELADIEAASSAMTNNPIVNSMKPGGIDFRVIPMVTKPMGNFSGLSLSLPTLSSSSLASINLDTELNQMSNMVKAGILPSGDRLKEYVAACYQKGELKQHLDGIVAFLEDTCKLEEQLVAETSNALKEVMLILDSAA